MYKLCINIKINILIYFMDLKQLLIQNTNNFINSVNEQSIKNHKYH